MTDRKPSDFLCAGCGKLTAILHCTVPTCDWLVCYDCELVVDDRHRAMPTRQRYLRELGVS